MEIQYMGKSSAMQCVMENLQRNPLKLYIQDLFRATQTLENKYIYSIFGLNFKNVTIHGVVTSIYNKSKTTTNLELSDPTGCVQVYFDTKVSLRITEKSLKGLYRDFAEACKFGDSNINIMETLLERISKEKDPMPFKEGDYVLVTGDIFIDGRDVRMISAFNCKVTSVEYDLVWLEELRYLYEKFYLWKKEDMA